MSDPNRILDTDEVFGENKKTEPKPEPEPTLESEEKKERELANKSDPNPKRQKTPMETYYERVRLIDGDYSNAIIEHAKKETYEIGIEKVDTEGNPLGEYEPKQFSRRKISAKMWEEVEELREDIFAETNRKKTRQLISKLYWICAREYFKMSQRDYERAAWEEIKLAVDAANFRTVKAIPFSR